MAKAPPRPTQADFDIDAMNQWLQYLGESGHALHAEAAVYVHPRVLSYKDAHTKANWTGGGRPGEEYFEGAGRRDTFAGFYKANTGGAKMRVALCATWTSSWVGKREEEIREMGWHCRGVAVINRPKGYGKNVVVWDNELEMPDVGGERRPEVHAKDLRVQSQREFVKATKHAKVQVLGL